MAQRALELLSFFVLWLLFVCEITTGEVLIGLAAAAIAVVGFEVSRRAEPLRFLPPLRAVAQIWRVPGLILQGTWVLIVELARRARGRRKRSLFQLTPFRAVGMDSRSAGKRVLAVSYVTLPPNFLIVGIDRKSKLMLFHQVRKDPVPEIIRRLESA